MKKNVFVSMMGAIALVSGVGLNTQNALNDYGIGENSLSLFVQAQTKTTSNGEGRNTNGFLEPKHYDCGIKITGDIAGAALTLGLKLGEVTAGGSLVVKDAGTNCEEGGKYQCIYRDCFMVMELMKRHN